MKQKNPKLTYQLLSPFSEEMTYFSDMLPSAGAFLHFAFNFVFSCFVDGCRNLEVLQ